MRLFSFRFFCPCGACKARQHLREMSLCFEKPANQVYTRSALAEQSTPVGVALSDSTAFVSNLTFPDLEPQPILDSRFPGCSLCWIESEEALCLRLRCDVTLPSGVEC